MKKITSFARFMNSQRCKAISGTTGSGKSKILSSGNRCRLESRQDKPVKIMTYEQPIECTYQSLGSGVMPKVST